MRAARWYRGTRREFRYGNHARPVPLRGSRHRKTSGACRRDATGARKVDLPSLFLSLFFFLYISPETRISDGGESEINEYSGATEHGVELCTAWREMRDEKKRGGEIEWSTREEAERRGTRRWGKDARKCPDVNAINLLGTLHFNIHPRLSLSLPLPDFLPLLIFFFFAFFFLVFPSCALTFLISSHSFFLSAPPPLNTFCVSGSLSLFKFFHPYLPWWNRARRKLRFESWI